jgi:hypothetical protein
VSAKEAFPNLPSRFQIGDRVAIVGTVVGVSFQEGKVLYDVQSSDGEGRSNWASTIYRVGSLDVYPWPPSRDPAPQPVTA